MDSIPAEVWLVFADLFLSKATLRALCLTCKHLNYIFTPVLYRNVFTMKDIATWSRDRKNLSELGSESHLKFTRHFDIGHTPRSCTPVTEVLEKLFDKMTGLLTCRVWALPDDAYHFCHPSVTHLTVSARYAITGLPHFQNLQCLDLRCTEESIDIPSLATLLLDSPGLHALALAEKFTNHHSIRRFPLLSLASAFEKAQESRGSLKSRLKLRHLALGPAFMARLPHLNKIDNQNQLSTLTDLSTLQTFHYLNGIPETGQFNHPVDVSFDGMLLLEATNLRKFTVDLVCRGVDYFIQNLTTGRPGNRTLYELEIAVGIHRQFALLTAAFTCGWRVLQLKGEGRWHEVLLECPDLEELSIPDGYITFEMINFRLFPSLRIFTTTCESNMSERRVAARFFRQHQRAMQDQDLISQLRYVGVNDKVYARGQQLVGYGTHTLNAPRDKNLEVYQLGCNPYGSRLAPMSSRRALRSRRSEWATADDESLDEDASSCLTELEEEEAQSFYLASDKQTHPLIPFLYRRSPLP
ncbi:uncharacterized protein PAC_01815 [Phialocephala subalpina]|uniref:F-box domain-containing protein n=1 Tax=Phialocephala subalpina TaxID=576137 RepID=A0A1L7WGP3_9HELO|nr:uncharacterized protein PAC_01815 [Phialocephala subalpina]